MQPTLIIGDVHGCADELDELLAKYAQGRHVMFVGDLVAKGPDSKGVVQRAREMGAHSVRGNHDVHVLKWRDATTRSEPPPAMRAHHREVAEVLSEADWQYLEALPFFLRLPAYDIVVVHAGLVPGKTLEDQTPYDMANMRSLRADGTASKQIGDGAPWASRWSGPEHVVFGHDAVTGLQQYEHATGIDTGCVYGRRLTGLCLPEWNLVYVDAHRVWCDLKGGER